MKRVGGDRVEARVVDLCREHSLSVGSEDALLSILGSLADDHAPTAVKDPKEGVDVHLADALSGLVAPELSGATGTIADIGSGCGIPAVPLAVALPGAMVIAVEAVGRKCDFISKMAATAGVSNVGVVKSRAEEWGAGFGSCEVVTARALAPLPVLAEYAAPLLVLGGSLVAWKGRPEVREHEAALIACQDLGLEMLDPIEVQPWPSGGVRTLVRIRKVADTPDRFPRRAGIAAKRPLGL